MKNMPETKYRVGGVGRIMFVTFIAALVLMLSGALSGALSGPLADGKTMFYAGLLLGILFFIYVLLDTAPDTGTKTIILYIMSFGIVFYTSVTVLWWNGLFHEADTWQYFGDIKTIALNTDMSLDTVFLLLSVIPINMGFHIFVYMLSVVIGMYNVTFFNTISLGLSVFPSVFVYLMMRNSGRQLAALSSFLTLFGVSYYIGQITITELKTLEISIILPALIYMNYLVFKDGYSARMLAIQFLLFFSMLSIHLWSTFLYLGFYFLVCISMIVRKGGDEKENENGNDGGNDGGNKNRVNLTLSIAPFFVYYSSLLIFVAFGPWTQIHPYLGVRPMTPYLFLLQVPIGLSFWLVNRYRRQIWGAVLALERLVRRCGRLGDIVFIGSLLGGILAAYLMFLNTPFETKKSFLEVVTSHLSLIVFLSMGFAGFVRIIQTEEKKDYLYVIVPWSVVSLSLVALVFVGKAADIPMMRNLIIDPWRQFSYLSILFMVPVSYALLSIRKHRRVISFVAVSSLVFMLLYSMPAEYPRTYQSVEEFDMAYWVKDNVPESASIIADNRVGAMVYGISLNCLKVWDKDYTMPFFKSPGNPRFVSAIEGWDNRTLRCPRTEGGGKYILWSDEYVKRAFFGVFEVGDIALGRDVEDAYEGSYVLNNLYSNGETEIYSINEDLIKRDGGQFTKY
jgi:hypothetical protein